jgi:hypothetical protein
VLKITFTAMGVAVGCYLVWQRSRRPGAGHELAPGIVIDPSKARAIFDLGREAVGASVEQALAGRLGHAA